MRSISHANMMTRLPPIPWYFLLFLELDNVLKYLQKMKHELIMVHYVLNNKLSECMDIILELCEENRFFTHKIQTIEEINFRLYAEVETLKLQLSNSINSFNIYRLRTQRIEENKSIMCECCCEEKTNNEFIKCSLGHFLCKSCVDRECKERIYSMQDPVDNIQCFCIHECLGKIDSSKLGSTFHGKTMLNEYNISNFKEVLVNYLKVFSKDEIEKNIAFLKADGSFRAFQCLMCNFGPILHANCDDLETHHDQQVDRTTKVSNKCPQCGFFSSSIRDFVQWNGHSRAINVF